MSLDFLSNLVSPTIRQPASCVVQVGAALDGLGDVARLAKSFEIRLDRSEAGTGTLVFEDRRKEDGQWIVADSGLFTRWQPIRLSADFGTYREEIFRGYMTSLRPSYPPNGGEATFEVQVQDDGSLLDREHIRRTWGEQAPESDRTILESLISPRGFSVDSESGDGRSSRSLAQDATPIRFLRDRAKANGYELIFDQGTVYFGPPRLSGDPMPAIMIYAGPATNCLSFAVEDDAMKPDQVRYDLAPADQGATPETETLGPDDPTLGSSAAASEGANLSAPFIWRLSREGDEPRDDTKARAQALANVNAMKLKATGEVDGSLYGHVLKPGHLVKVDGAGGRYGGTYYIDKVTHGFTPEGYKQHFELLRNATGEDGGGAGGALSAIASLFG
jgi:hypothetical protein